MESHNVLSQFVKSVIVFELLQIVTLAVAFVFPIKPCSHVASSSDSFFWEIDGFVDDFAEELFIHCELAHVCK